jgi:hypothetical protein
MARNSSGFFKSAKANSFFVRDGLVAQFNGDSVANYTAESGRVGYWRDSVNGYYVTQSSAGNKPTVVVGELNGRTGFGFTTGRTLLSSGTLATNNLATLIDQNAAHTVFIVSKRSNTSATNMTAFSLGTSGSTGNSLQWGSFAYIGAASGSDIIRVGNSYEIEGRFLDFFSGSVNSYKFDGTYFNTKINGVSSMVNKTLTGTNMTMDSFFIGTAFYSGSTSYGYIGNLYEILVYNRALTENEVHKMHIYLSNKYGINNNVL